MESERHLTESQLAERWRVPATLLAEWRAARVGPSWRALGKRILYRLGDVESVERERKRGSAPTYLDVCGRHGLTWFRRHMSGKGRNGAPKGTRRCLSCMKETEARRNAKRRNV